MLKWTIIITLLFGHLTSNAQSPYALFGVQPSGLTTQLQGVESFGLNAANLANDTSKFSFYIGAATTNLSSEYLLKQDLWGFITTGTLNFSIYNPSYVKNVLTEPNFVDLNLNYGGFSFQLPKDWSIGFSVNEQAQWQSRFSLNFANFITNTNAYSTFDSLDVIRVNDTTTIESDSLLSQDVVISGKTVANNSLNSLFKDSRVLFIHYRNYMLGISKKIRLNRFNMSIGTVAKLVESKGQVNFNSTTTEDTQVFSVPGYDPENNKSSTLGYGFGVDFGLNFEFNRIRFGVAANNIGFVNYSNSYALADSLEIEYELTSQTDTIDGSVNSFIETINEFTDNITNNSRTTQFLPTNLSLGFDFKVIENLILGGQIFIPLNKAPGNLTAPMILLSMQYFPIKWLGITISNMMTKNYGYNFPLGIIFRYGKGRFESSISTMDLITLFTQQSPSISINCCLLKFRL